MPDRYSFKNFNAAYMAVGPEATIAPAAAGAQTLADLPGLAAELEILKQALIREAKSTADYQAVAEIQAAHEAADAGDEATIVRHLANAGRWVFDIAVRIGTEMAAAALKHALGIG